MQLEFISEKETHNIVDTPNSFTNKLTSRITV